MLTKIVYHCEAVEMMYEGRWTKENGYQVRCKTIDAAVFGSWEPLITLDDFEQLHQSILRSGCCKLDFAE